MAYNYYQITKRGAEKAHKIRYGVMRQLFTPWGGIYSADEEVLIFLSRNPQSKYTVIQVAQKRYDTKKPRNSEIEFVRRLLRKLRYRGWVTLKKGR